MWPLRAPIAPSRFDYSINLSGYSLPGSKKGDPELQRSKPPAFWDEVTSTM